jgi:hypothetical protein
MALVTAALGLAEADYSRFLAPDLAFEELDARPHGIRWKL